MPRPVPPAEKQLAISLASLICAFYWRADEIGEHRIHGGACPSCQRLVNEDLHGLMARFLAAGLTVGAESSPDVPSGEWSGTSSGEPMQEVAERCVKICAEHRERVIGSDPRTFERRSDRYRTDYAEVVFAAKEFPGGGAWIILEPSGPTLPVLKAENAHLGLYCRDGVSLEEVTELAEAMRSKLRGVSCTGRA